jgi:hypothetical protein
MVDSHLESDVTGLTALNGTTPVWPAKAGVFHVSDVQGGPTSPEHKPEQVKGSSAHQYVHHSEHAYVNSDG